jgi:hypothetical protein
MGVGSKRGSGYGGMRRAVCPRCGGCFCKSARQIKSGDTVCLNTAKCTARAAKRLDAGFATASLTDADATFVSRMAEIRQREKRHVDAVNKLLTHAQKRRRGATALEALQREAASRRRISR